MVHDEPHIVVIGGGTGSFELLSGFKKYTSHLTALVSMADDGGSTGILRDELGVLPPGDIRKCLVALARSPKMRDLFSYRFEEGGLAGHAFGNLFLTAVEKMTDDFTHAVDLAGKVLNITGRVLPITLDKVQFVLEEKGGRITRGQHKLNEGIIFAQQRPTVRLEPAATITDEAAEAIKDADFVVIAPGSLYSSLAAVLVVRGVSEALQNTKAKKVYVCNLVTEHGQTDGFKVHDYAAEIERFLGGQVRLDYLLYNTYQPSNGELVDHYAKEHRTWVEYDELVLSKQLYAALGDNFVHQEHNHHTKYIRHNADAVAQTLLGLRK